MTAERRVARKRRQHREARHQPGANPPIVIGSIGIAARALDDASGCLRDLELRMRTLRDDVPRARHVVLGRLLHRLETVEKAQMTRVNVALETLQPMTILISLRDIDLIRGNVEPFEIGQRRLFFGRPHIGHDDAVTLDAGIGDLLYLFLELRLRRLVRHVDAIAVDVVFPAVIPAAQAAVAVLAEMQRRAAMGAMLAEQADAALTVAKSDEVLAQEPHALRRAIGFYFARQERRQPKAAQQIAQGRTGAGAR